MTSCNTVASHFHDPAGAITLDETARHRRRMAMISDNGIEFLLDLPEARLLRHGDGLVLSDGSIGPFFTRPISMVFAAVTIFTILLYVPAFKAAVSRARRAVTGTVQGAFGRRA